VAAADCWLLLLQLMPCQRTSSVDTSSRHPGVQLSRRRSLSSRHALTVAAAEAAAACAVADEISPRT